MLSMYYVEFVHYVGDLQALRVPGIMSWDGQ